MAQLSDDCFAHGGALMPAAAALAELRARLAPVGERETVPLSEAAGRILAADLIADRDVPPHDNAAVDGYAVHFADLAADRDTELPVTGRAAAGHSLGRPARRGEAIRIFTGAVMPDGPDTVMMQEDCTSRGDVVVIRPGIGRGANRRRRGEDVRVGTIVLRDGQRLRPQDVGLAAALGRPAVPVYRRLRVAILSTGDEVHEPGTALPLGAVYDANRYALVALVKALGAAPTDLGILADEAAAIDAALTDAATGHDLILTSGGMSVGEEDHIAGVVRARGSLYFWKLAIKPGRPVAMGQIGGTPLIGLPGNPAAMMVTFLRLARPALLRLAGAPSCRAAPVPRYRRVRPPQEAQPPRIRARSVGAGGGRRAHGRQVPARGCRDPELPGRGRRARRARRGRNGRDHGNAGRFFAFRGSPVEPLSCAEAPSRG